MTIDAGSSANRHTHSRVSSPVIPRPRQAADDLEPESLPLLLGGWQAYQRFVPTRPASTPDPLTAPTEAIVPASPTGLKARLSRRFEVYRVNRAFRRNQREFDNAMDSVAHDPAGQRELKTSWDLRD